jgi:hypothetical protein
VGGANIQIVHYFDHGYLQVEKSMIHSLLLLEQNIWHAWSIVFLPTKISFLFKNNILHQSKNRNGHRLCDVTDKTWKTVFCQLYIGKSLLKS